MLEHFQLFVYLSVRSSATLTARCFQQKNYGIVLIMFVFCTLICMCGAPHYQKELNQKECGTYQFSILILDDFKRRKQNKTTKHFVGYKASWKAIA